MAEVHHHLHGQREKKKTIYLLKKITVKWINNNQTLKASFQKTVTEMDASRQHQNLFPLLPPVSTDPPYERFVFWLASFLNSISSAWSFSYVLFRFSTYCIITSVALLMRFSCCTTQSTKLLRLHISGQWKNRAYCDWTSHTLCCLKIKKMSFGQSFMHPLILTHLSYIHLATANCY